MRIHLVSETEFGVKGMGIHTAHIDLIRLLKEKNEVKVVINNEGYGDVFHAHSYGLYYFLKGRKYKGKRIHTVHTIPETLKGSVPFYKFVKPFADIYFRWVYNYADVCIAISPKVEETLKDLDVKSKIVRINNPINLDNWHFTAENRNLGRQFLGCSKNEKVVLGVGQLQKRKGVEDFIEMAKQLPEFTFVWVGGRPFGRLTEGVKRIDEKIKAAPSNCKFVGMLDLEKMPLVYAASDIFVFSSYQENSPLAPIEAAACGLPIIFRDLIEYRLLYDCPYIKANTNEEFVQKIRQLGTEVEINEAAKTMSANLVKLFDKNVIYEQLMGLYISIYNNKV